MPHQRRGDKLAVDDVDVESGIKTASIRSMYKYILILYIYIPSGYLTVRHGKWPIYNR
jgi:hypothetical protein